LVSPCNRVDQQLNNRRRRAGSDLSGPSDSLARVWSSGRERAKNLSTYTHRFARSSLWFFLPLLYREFWVHM